MAAKDTFEIPLGMRRVCRRFERWRAGHKARLPIRGVVDSSGGSDSGAWGFPHGQGPAPGVRQAQTNGGRGWVPAR